MARPARNQNHQGPEIQSHHGENRRAGRVRMRLAIVAAAAIALVVAPAAAAWSAYYVQDQWFGPGGIGLSAFNSGLQYNLVTFNGNGFDYMQLTLCDASYACYPYTYSVYSFDDYRSISYGRAKCNAWQQNIQDLYVHYCFTRNY